MISTGVSFQAGRGARPRQSSREGASEPYGQHHSDSTSGRKIREDEGNLWRKMEGDLCNIADSQILLDTRGPRPQNRVLDGLVEGAGSMDGLTPYDNYNCVS